MTPRVAILISGHGTNMLALIERFRSGELPGEVAFVASDNPDAPGLEKASALGVRTKTYPYREKGRFACEEAMRKDMNASGVEWIILAGFMKVLSPAFVSAYPGKIVNIHPSLLPAFPGVDAIGQAWRHGVKITGVTVHLVDEKVDHGPILAQEALPIRTGESIESLESRVHEIEHGLYWVTLRDIFKGIIRIPERRSIK
jgi:phosphoribosylglycinamide formyltransferase-1